MKNDIYGLILGEGELVEELITKIEKRPQKYFAVYINNNPKHKLKNNEICVPIGKVGKIINFLEKNKVNKIIFTGAVEKPILSKLTVDFQGAILLTRIIKNKLFGDDNILSNVISYIEEKGFIVISICEILTDLQYTNDYQNNQKSTEIIQNDINIGRNILNKISEFDIGQSIIVQYGKIIAIEAAEGTDNLIKRSMKYIDVNHKSPAILIKSPKKNQDLRIDIPTIGPNTIQNMIYANIKCLAIDRRNLLIVKKQETYKLAKENNILIFSF
jgi:UDP-2,3-diacylglucosamine hydrolase